MTWELLDRSPIYGSGRTCQSVWFGYKAGPAEGAELHDFHPIMSCAGSLPVLKHWKLPPSPTVTFSSPNLHSVSRWEAVSERCGGLRKMRDPLSGASAQWIEMLKWRAQPQSYVFFCELYLQFFNIFNWTIRSIIIWYLYISLTRLYFFIIG